MSSPLFLNIAIYIIMFSEVESMIGQPQTLIDNAKRVSIMAHDSILIKYIYY